MRTTSFFTGNPSSDHILALRVGVCPSRAAPSTWKPKEISVNIRQRPPRVVAPRGAGTPQRDPRAR